jgi:phage terminase large subunit-like protein
MRGASGGASVSHHGAPRTDGAQRNTHSRNSMTKKPKNTGGRPRKTIAELQAAGSWRAGARAREALPKPKAKRIAATGWKPPTARQLKALMLLVPGYDPHADAAGCKFDNAAAVKALKFIESELRHVEGRVAGKLFRLEDWQRAIVVNLFGWKRKDATGRWVRRYREAFIFVARKNGKSPLAAAIALYCLFEDNEPGAQIVCAAAKRDQAALLFRHARGMVQQSPRLTVLSQIFAGVGQRSIVLKEDAASGFKVISADAGTEHGANLSAAIIDELHAQPNRDLVDVIQTSMASANRAQPLLVHVTTADFARESICNEKHDYACKVRDGIITDSAFLPVIFEAPQDSDWTLPETWAMANPNLGVSVSLDYLERECSRAQETPTFENSYKRLHLNMRTETDVRWLQMDKWDEGGDPDPLAWRTETMELLAGALCTGGLDLSTAIDVTAFVLSFDRDGVITLLPFFWIPESNARKREHRDRVPYITWARQGFLKMTSGDVVDYDVVRADINELAKTFNIRRIARDRWNASQITNQLMGDGLEMVDCGQGFASMSDPSKELEKLIIGCQLRHGSNPVLRWMASNTAAETDAAGNIKPSKKKSTERIDGIVAAVMAIGCADPGDGGSSIYSEPGNLEL